MLALSSKHKATGILLALVFILIIVVWVLDFSTYATDEYYMNIWFPIIISTMIGALGMHINMSSYAVPVSSTSTEEVAHSEIKKQAINAQFSTSNDDDAGDRLI